MEKVLTIQICFKGQQTDLADVRSFLDEKLEAVKWTPLFGPGNAEFKFVFQVLPGLFCVYFIALRSDRLHAFERAASSPKGAPRRGDRRTGRRSRLDHYFQRQAAGFAPYDSGE